MNLRNAVFLLVFPILFLACDPCRNVDPNIVCNVPIKIEIIDSNGINIFKNDFNIDSLQIIALNGTNDNFTVDTIDNTFSIVIFNCKDLPNNNNMEQTADYLLKLNQTETDTLFFRFKIFEGECEGNNYDYLKLKYYNKIYEPYIYQLNLLTRE
jgi:hypothetical protein